VGHFASELGSNPHLHLIVFAMRMDLKPYTEQMLNIHWPSAPSARLVVTLEKGKWAGRLVSA